MSVLAGMETKNWRLLTSGALQTRDPALGSNFLDVVPHMFFNVISSMVRLALIVVSISPRRPSNKGTYRELIAKRLVLLSITLSDGDRIIVILMVETIVSHVPDPAETTSSI